MEFVSIPAGIFTMGSPPSVLERGPKELLHEVTISKGFCLGKYEVTQRQWQAVMRSNPSFHSGPEKPVEQVSWYDVQVFVQKLNAAVGDSLYRLPSEAEWEYACRAGTTTRWSFGDNESDLGLYSWYSGNNSPSGPKGVGTKLANPWGLFDMHGNVGEWCLDWDGDYSEGIQVDPVGPASGSRRVRRGGFWFFPADYTRSAHRSSYSPDGRSSNIGFRLLRRTQ